MFIRARCIGVTSRIMCPKDEYEILDVEIKVRNADGSPATDIWGGSNTGTLDVRAQYGKIPLGRDGLLRSYEGVYPSSVSIYGGCPVISFVTCPLGHNISENPVGSGPEGNEGLFIVQPQGTYYVVCYDIWGRDIGDAEWEKINDKRCEEEYQMAFLQTADVNYGGTLCVPGGRVKRIPAAVFGQ